MKKLILFVVLFFAVTTLVNADGITRRVKFQKGQFAATFEGGVIRGDRDIYLVKASKNYVMNVSISSDEDNAVFRSRIQRPAQY